MVGPGGGIPPADCLLKAGDAAIRPIIRSAVLATVHMWVGKWKKSSVVEKIVMTFSEAQVYDALKLLCDICGRDDPKKRQDSNKRPKGEAFAIDIHDTVEELDKKKELPDIVVPSDQVKFCPVETVNDNDPGMLVRMERLEKVVLEMANRPAALQTVQSVQQAAPLPAVTAGRPGAASVTGPGRRGTTGGGFGEALERARSLSRDGRQEQGGGGREQPGSHPDSYAGRAAKRSRPGDVNGDGLRVPGRPGDVDNDGFRVPGRPARKAVPKGCSTVDLSGMARAVVAPLHRYVGGINRDATKEDVLAVLRKCAAELPGGNKIVFSGLEKLTGHPSARTQSWKFTVPYSCRQLLENPALYPQGWTHRAYFAPRGDRNKRQKEGGAGGAAAAPLLRGGGGEALLREDQQEDGRPLELEVLELARVAATREAAAAVLPAA